LIYNAATTLSPVPFMTI